MLTHRLLNTHTEKHRQREDTHIEDPQCKYTDIHELV